MADSIEQRLQRVLADLRSEGLPPAAARPPRTLSDRLRACATPGVSIGVIDGFEVAWTGGFGVRAGRGPPVTARTRFQAASISKPVFALAVMRLVEAGTLDLDADVARYLTSWRVPETAGWRPRLTLRRLLSHTAGTTVDGFMGYPTTATLPTPAQTLDGAPPANNPPVIVDRLPGLRSRYSGGGTTIAQQAVVDRLGEPFPALMRALVLDPLGMTDSSFEQPPSPAVATEAATGHPWNGIAIPGGWHVYPELAAAGLWSSAADLARLAAAVMGALAERNAALGLTRASVAEMLRPPRPDPPSGAEYPGLGWFCRGAGRALRFGHQGWNQGFVCELCAIPATGQGAIVMLNSNQGAPLRAEILQAIAREFGWPALEEPAPAARSAPARHAGRYRSAAGLEVELVPADHDLMLRVADQPPVPLEALSGTDYRARAIALSVRLDADTLTLIEDGTPTALTRVTSPGDGRS